MKIENIQKFKGKINGILIEEQQLFETVQFISALFEMKFDETTKKETKIIVDSSETADDFIKKLKKSDC